jgi:hypothetical protein
VAKSERETKEIMRTLGKYVREKKLEVNVEKTKMMVFNKRKRKNEENGWKWKGKAHIREIVRKANKVARCVENRRDKVGR